MRPGNYIKKYFRVVRSPKGVFLEPRYNLNDFERIERKLRKRRK